MITVIGGNVKVTIGNAVLYHGDCLEIMKGIDSNSIDMILTDPPYGTTVCKWDSVIPLEPMWEQLKRIIKSNGAIVMTASQPFTTTLISSNMKMFRYCWVWEKSHPSNFMLAKKMPLKYHEDVCIFSLKKLPGYYPIKTYAGKKVHSTKNSIVPKIKPGGIYRNLKEDPNYDNTSLYRYPTSVQRFNSPQHNDGVNGLVHPTQKPVTLMEYLIKTYTNEGETVIDFTMGSGTTGVACMNLGRKFIGIEIEERYFQIACERIDAAQRQGKLFEEVQQSTKTKTSLLPGM